MTGCAVSRNPIASVFAEKNRIRLKMFKVVLKIEIIKKCFLIEPRAERGTHFMTVLMKEGGREVRERGQGGRERERLGQREWGWGRFLRFMTVGRSLESF